MSTIYSKLSKKKADNGKQQIYLRVVINAKNRPQLKSGVYIKPEWWQQIGKEHGEIRIPQKGKLNFVERNEAMQAKSTLDVIINRLEKISQETEANAPERLNKEWIENADKVIRANGIATEHITYNTICTLLADEEDKADEEEKEIKKLPFFDVWQAYTTNHNGVKRRKDHLRVVMRALQRFELYSGKILDIDTFGSESLRQFRDFLENEHTFFEVNVNGEKVCKRKYAYIYNKVYEKNAPVERSKNYIVGEFKILRAFFKWSVREGYTTNEPFRRFSLTKDIGSEVYGIPYFLTIEERNKLYNFDLSAIPHLERQRDIFVFQCCVGCRVGDLRRLKSSNIIQQGDVTFLSYVPSKTKNETNKVAEVPLNNIAKEIVDKYKGKNDKYLLPTISGQKYNDAIKEVLLAAGIDRVVAVLNSKTRTEEHKPIWQVASSHMARRTFIGNLYKRTPDPNIIGSMSGHVEGSRAFARYRAIDNDMKIKIINITEEE